MARDTTRGLHVWDLGTDNFDHDELASNWDRLETLISQGSQSIETLSSVPSSGNFAGRTVMLSTANSGFAAWSMIMYDGTKWKALGPIEILPAIPSVGNFAGRIIILSAPDTGFLAWDVIRYDGSAWGVLGGWQSVNTGAGALNIQGVETTGDVSVNHISRGLILKDRSTNIKRRVYIDNGLVKTEVVS